MLHLKISYGDVVKLIDNETGKAIGGFTVRGVSTTEGIDLFNIAIDTSERYKIQKVLLKENFSFKDE